MTGKQRLPLVASGIVILSTLAVFFKLRHNIDGGSLALWLVSPQIPLLLVLWLSKERSLLIIATTLSALFWLSSFLSLAIGRGGASGVFLPLFQWAAIVGVILVGSVMGALLFLVEFTGRCLWRR